MSIDAAFLCRLPSPWDTPNSHVVAQLHRKIGCVGVELEVAPNDTHLNQTATWRSGFASTADKTAAKPTNTGDDEQRSHRDRFGAWTFTAAPDNGAFTDSHRQLLDLVLLRWHNNFMSGPVSEGAHVLLDANKKLITADLKMQTWLAGCPNGLNELLEKAAAVVDQRFKPAHAYRPVEVILNYEGQAVWIQLTASSTATGQSGGYYGQLRLVPNEEVPTFDRLEDDRVARTLGFLDTHYGENPDLKVLAKSSGLSIYHLHRLFSEHIGMSPKQYLLCRQLQVAKWLLRSSIHPIAEISDMTGFSSPGHFSTTFHRLQNIKPNQYRDQMKSKS